MIKIEITVEQLLNMIEKAKPAIKERLEKELQRQADYFCGKENLFQIKRRNWVLLLQDIKDNNGTPIENAFAIYTNEDDKIILTEELYKNLFFFMQACEFQLEHAMWMIFIALIFCVSHEMSHLYAGHCQLCKKNKLGINYNPKTGLSYLEHQAIEIEADHIAAGRIAEIVSSIFLNGDYERVFRYKSKDMFYSDSIKAICRFFYYVRYIGKEDKMYKMNIEHITHPPSFFRCVWSVVAFIEHYKLYFEDKTELFLAGFINDLKDKETFGETFLEDSKDGKLDSDMLIEYYNILQGVFNEGLKDKIKESRRMPFVHEYLDNYNLTLNDFKKKYSDFHLF